MKIGVENLPTIKWFMLKSFISSILNASATLVLHCALIQRQIRKFHFSEKFHGLLGVAVTLVCLQINATQCSVTL